MIEPAIEQALFTRENRMVKVMLAFLIINPLLNNPTNPHKIGFSSQVLENEANRHMTLVSDTFNDFCNDDSDNASDYPGNPSCDAPAGPTPDSPQ